MNFYVATGLSNHRAADAMADALTAAGHRQTYRWTEHGSVQATPERWAGVAGSEVQGVLDADCVVALLPGGRGTHVEIGMALGLGKLLILVGDMVDENGRTCVFYHHPRVRRVDYRPVGDGLPVAAVLEAMRE